MKVLDGYDVNITRAKLLYSAYYQTHIKGQTNIVSLYVAATSQIIVWPC